MQTILPWFITHSPIQWGCCPRAKIVFTISPGQLQIQGVKCNNIRYSEGQGKVTSLRDTGFCRGWLLTGYIFTSDGYVCHLALLKIGLVLENGLERQGKCN